MLYFITGNNNKFEEIKLIIPQIKQINIDLPEIQELNPKLIIKAKLLEGFKQLNSECIVEDSSLYFQGLNGLPGPLIKRFIESIGNEGLYNLCDKLGNYNAIAKTIIGYISQNQEVHFFQGELEGKIVKPCGENGFGRDNIFMPNGFNKTLGQMNVFEKNQISMRKQASEKLKTFLKM